MSQTGSVQIFTHVCRLLWIFLDVGPLERILMLVAKAENNGGADLTGLPEERGETFVYVNRWIQV